MQLNKDGIKANKKDLSALQQQVNDMKSVITTDNTTTDISITPETNTESVFTNDAVTAVEIIIPTDITAGFNTTVSWLNPSTPPSFTLTDAAEHTIHLFVNGEVAASYAPTGSKTALMMVYFNGSFVLISITEM